MTVPSVYEPAAALLSDVGDCLINNNRELPDRRYVANGSIAFDCCSELVVQVESVAQGSVGQPVNVATRIGWYHANIAVWVVRCAPVMADDGTPPSAEAIDGSARGILEDARALLECARRRMTGCNDVALTGITIVGPEGGCVAAVLRLSIQL